jgi:hypothetical protein
MRTPRPCARLLHPDGVVTEHQGVDLPPHPRDRDGELRRPIVIPRAVKPARSPFRESARQAIHMATSVSRPAFMEGAL